MKYQVLFSLKNNEKIFKTVVCCGRDWYPNTVTHRVKKKMIRFDQFAAATK